jgi:spore germination protein YaaH
VQGWYEDDEAFAAKMDLVQQQDLGGVCLWVLDGPRDPRSIFERTKKYLQPR